MPSVQALKRPLPAGKNPAEAANDEIIDALAAQRHGEASRLVETALGRWPTYVRLQLTKGEVLTHSAGPYAAASHFIALLDGGPAQPWALGRLKMVLSASRFGRGDCSHLIEAIAASGLDATAKTRLIEPLLQSLEGEDLLHVLRSSAPRSGLFRLEWKLAIAETERGNVEAAIAILEEARSGGRINETATTLLSELLAASNRIPEAIDLLTQSVQRDPDRPDPQRRMIALYQRVGDFERAGELMQQAAARWPDDWMLLFRLNRLPLRPDRLRAAFDAFSSAADAAAARDERFRFQFALACLHAGEIERAQALLKVPFTPPVDKLVLPVVRALSAREPEFWRTMSRLEDDRCRDVQITRAENARLTVIVPTGIAFGYLPPAMIDALFAHHGVNAVYLRDYRKRAYLRGIASLGRDEAETVAALRRIVADLGAPRTVVMGSSLGGFAALRIGQKLGAYAALSFSGPTDLEAVYDNTRPSIWNPSYFLKLTLQKEPDLQTDLRPVLSSAGHTRFFQLYGEGEADDVRQARRLEGLANVSIMSVPKVNDHILVDHLIANGSFDAILRTLAN